MNIDFKISRSRKRDEHGEIICAFLRHHKGNSSTQSNPNNSTEITDNRVAASEGSVSAGSGANVSIVSSDPETIKAAGDAISRMAEGNVDVASTAISGNVSSLRDAFDFGGKALAVVQSGNRDALDFGDSVVQRAINAAATTQQSANDLIQHTNDSFASKLASNAGPAPTAVADNLVKYISIVAGVVGVAYVFKKSN